MFKLTDSYNLTLSCTFCDRKKEPIKRLRMKYSDGKISDLSICRTCSESLRKILEHFDNPCPEDKEKLTLKMVQDRFISNRAYLSLLRGMYWSDGSKGSLSDYDITLKEIQDTVTQKDVYGRIKGAGIKTGKEIIDSMEKLGYPLDKC